MKSNHQMDYLYGVFVQAEDFIKIIENEHGKLSGLISNTIQEFHSSLNFRPFQTNRGGHKNDCQSQSSD